MPPQISDDDTSDVSEDAISKEEEATVVERKGKGKLVVKETEEEEEEEEDFMVKSDGNEDEEDSEQGADVYVVEAILSHFVDEDNGKILYEVKWEGYDKKGDRTWEPEENLSTAPQVLDEYLAEIGGKELILSQWKEKKAEIKGKKRGRASIGTGDGANGTVAKKNRKNGNHPASSNPPAGVKESEFKPPTGSWESDVVNIDACEGSQGTVVVYLTWKGGQKSQHPLHQVYKRCPQQMLRFYEDHLVFQKNDDADEAV